jgi:murein DD-endopeptidase MepM/ murein hydrolase activator NlpD
MDRHSYRQPNADALSELAHRQKRQQGAAYLAFFLLLSACLNPLPGARVPTSSGLATQTNPPAGRIAPAGTEAVGEEPTATFTPVAVGEGGQATEGTLSEAGPTPFSDPLRFTFPSPAPAPVSAWRPPLYPTPWALSPHDHFYFARPIAADEVNWPLWDYRYGGVFFEGVIHTGIDIDVATGTPVLAAGSGKVVWAGYGLYRGYEDLSDPYGLAVAIDHDFGYQGQALYTVYGHLEQVDVAAGQHVEVGQRLGLSGQTGHATGPHLHFEVRLGEDGFFTTRNPELWLEPPQGWGVLAGRITEAYDRLKTGQEVIVHSLSSGQNWIARTYGGEAINSDEYYRENLVVGDLPAGMYEIRIAYAGFNNVLQMEILPGVVNYFSFRIRKGFSTEMPPDPGADYTPPANGLPTTTPTP